MKKYNYISDLHGHSYYSDGNSTPKEIVNEAIKNKINFIALTDHNNTKGLKEFEEETKKTEGKVIGIPGMEVTTELGHILFLFSSVKDAIKFGSKGIKEHTVNSSKYVLDKSKDFKKYIILPHPHIPFAQAISFDQIDNLLNKYSDLAPYIGMEAINGMSLIMPTQMTRKSKKTESENKKRGWNRKLFANSDFHTNFGIGVAVTELISKVKINSAKDFIENIHNGQTEGNIKISKNLSFPKKVQYFSQVIMSGRRYKSRG